MNDEKWGEIKFKITDKFKGFEEKVENDFIEDDLGNKIPQKTETLIFKSGLGNTKLVRSGHPSIIDKKPHYHKGAGGARLEFITDPEEFSYKFEAFIEKDGDWEKLDIPADRLNF